MAEQGALLRDIGRLLGGLPARRRGQLGLLIGLMFAGALAEVLSLGAVVPFLAVLTDPVLAMRQPFVGGVISFLGLTDDEDLRWTLTLLFGGAAVGAGAVRILLIFVTARLNFGVGHELGAEVYRRTLYQPYEVHVGRNTSAILGGLNKVDIVVFVVFSLLNTCSAILMAVCIVVTLLRSGSVCLNNFPRFISGFRAGLERQSCPRRRASLATNDRRGGQLGARHEIHLTRPVPTSAGLPRTFPAA